MSAPIARGGLGRTRYALLLYPSETTENHGFAQVGVGCF